VALFNKQYQYSYPNGLALAPDSDLHKRLLDEVMARARLAHDALAPRYTDWEATNNKMTFFIPTSEKERLTKNRDSRKPVAVVLPLLYANYDAFATQVFSAYSAEDEIHAFRGRGPEDTIPAMLGEKVIAAESAYFDELDTINTSIRDCMVCGFGPMYAEWCEELGSDVVRKPVTSVDPYTGEEFETGEEVEQEWDNVVKFEGNKTKNIQPQYCLPDPSVPIHKVREMEFFGWGVHTTLIALQKLEAQNAGYFNVRYLKDGDFVSTSIFAEAFAVDRSASQQRIGNPYPDYSGTSLKPIDLIVMFWELIPADWDLGGSKVPQQWKFVVAGDSVLIYAKPLGLKHGRFPVVCPAPDTDGYATTPLGRLEVGYGTQEAVDFLWNVKAAAIRQAAQLRFLLDPSRVNLKDIANIDKTRFIRVARLAFGTGFDSVIKQLEIRETSAQSVPDIVALDEWMQRSMGSTNTLSGMARQHGERQSATEFRGIRASALSRVDRFAQLFSTQGIRPLGNIMLAQTIQYRSQESYVRLIGRYEDELRKEYGVQSEAGTPGFEQDPMQATHFPVGIRMLDCNYDCISSDSLGKGEDYIDTWVNLYGMIMQNPMLMQQLDMMRIFKHIARLGGAKNVGDFVMNGPPVAGMVMGQEGIDEGVASGKLEPLMPAQEAMGKAGTTYGG
jgi:hypothetical protein